MEENIGQQINDVVNNLADKLGVTADKLYPILIKQASIEGIKATIGILIGLVLLIVSTKVMVKAVKNPNVNDRGNWDGSNHAKFWLGLIISIIFFCTVMGICLMQ